MTLNPHHAYRKIREQQVCQVLPDNLWAIGRYNDIVHALGTPDIFSSAETCEILQQSWMRRKKCGLDNYLIAFEDRPTHAIHRGVIEKHFNKHALAQREVQISQIAYQHAGRIHQRGSFDFIDEFSNPYVDETSGHFLNITDKETLSKGREWISLFETQPRHADTHFCLELDQARTRLASDLNDIIFAKKNNIDDSITSTLANAANGEFTEKLIDRKNILELLFLASTQITPHLITRGVMELIHNRPLLDELLSDPDGLLPAFDDELARLYSPIHLLPRRTTQATNIGGKTIPKHQPILVVLAAANRDPEQFPNPNEINLHRNNKGTHLAYSMGIHRCLGRKLARLQMRSAFKALLPLIPHMSCPAINSLSWNYSLIVHNLQRLPITIHNHPGRKL